MGGPNGRYPQMGAGGRAPVRASSVTDIHSLYSGLPGMLIIFSIFSKISQFFKVIFEFLDGFQIFGIFFQNFQIFEENFMKNYEL